MKITETQKSGIVILRIEGNVDVESINTLDNTIKDALFIREKDVLLDMGDLKQINSIGMAVIGYYAAKAREDGLTFALFSNNSSMEDFLQANGLAGMVVIYPDLEAALLGISREKNSQQ